MYIVGRISAMSGNYSTCEWSGNVSKATFSL